ncbi:short chain dehydrogenase [Colletotrichum sojae]|uniref:Short chain dehydrogenase n=1 Tax=Colletotrichum sojae TaxID=2175907 RepID=A0A8H6JIC9_9PEZI|nr:short chain dehydrogenase [Colletotrichum sojae]
MSTNFKYTTKLHSKRILILGGTSGIGYAVAQASLEHGAGTVILSSSSAPRLGDAVLRLRESYPDLDPSRIVIHPCDLSDRERLDVNVEKLLDAVTRGGSVKLDHVVFTAGDARSLGSLSKVTVEQFEVNQIVRGIAPIIVAKHLPRYLNGGPDCSYTLTGGFTFSKPPPGFGLVAASGLEGLTRGLAVDMAPVRVNLVSPGVVRTEALRGLPEEVLRGLEKETTTGRLGRPEDVAEAYLYLMKDGFVTGSVVQTNGGRLLV